MWVPVQVQVAASARSSVVSTNANRASNGTSRIKRLLTTASLVLQDLSQSFSRMNLAALVIGDAARPPRIAHSFHHRFLRVRHWPLRLVEQVGYLALV